MSIAKGKFTPENNRSPAQGYAGLEEIFNDLFDRLVYFSFQLVKDKHHAHDIVQEVFIKYWFNKESVNADKSAIKNFLYAGVRNASLNIVRHNKVVENHVRQQDRIEPEERPVIDAIIAAEVRARLHAALQSLPDSYRIVSTMSYLDEKKNHEIAGELAMSVNTVKKQKYRALELLRMKLDPKFMTL